MKFFPRWFFLVAVVLGLFSPAFAEVDSAAPAVPPSSPAAPAPKAAPLSKEMLVTGPVQLIGMTLEDMFKLFKTPKSVYAVRGPEAWQDDVVFVYDEADFYVYKGNVWQIGLNLAYNVKKGDPRAAVLQAAKYPLEESGERYLQWHLQDAPWITRMRANLDKAGLVSAIFVYRSDF